MIFTEVRKMKKWLACVNEYQKECDWKDLTLIKFCLCAAGVMIGLCVPKKQKKYPFIIAAVIFIATYIPLMIKFICSMKKNLEK